MSSRSRVRWPGKCCSSARLIPSAVQLERTPRAFPTLRFTRAVDDIDGFTPDDFAVEGYEPHAGIKMSMSV